MSRVAPFVLCLLLTLNMHGSLSAQNPLFATGEIHKPGTPITNAQVEAGLRKNREALRNTPPFQTHDAPTHLRLAEMLSQQGDPNGAIEEYQAAIQLNPEMAKAFQGLGGVYIDTHEWEKAEQALRKGVKLNPQDHQTWYWLGRSLIAQEHFQQAQEVLVTATHLSPHEVETFSDLGLACMAQGQSHEAEMALKNAIDLQPDFAEAHHRLEQVRAAQENPQQLMQLAQDILHTLFRRE
ncbi:MAG: tetratricopeptide repeat protein [Nitrospirota bacterium]|nr:tetratricopeptide repeat protein [Nitrospirota bacterium]